jgi:PAS domain S-box-containing protein
MNLQDRPRGAAAALDFRRLFEAVPGPFLVLLPDDPNYTIVAISDAYANATLTDRKNLLGRAMFDAFPENPADPAGTGVNNLRASLRRVLATGKADTMPIQKYDIRRPEEHGGGFEERYWSPMNSPVLDEDGSVQYIIHRAADVTEFQHLKLLEVEQLAETERNRADRIAAELSLRSHELAGIKRLIEERERARVEQRESEERLTFALDAGGGVGTFEWDVRRDRIFSDERFAKLFSVDPQRAASGVLLSEFAAGIHPDDHADVMSKVQEAIATGNDYAAEYRLLQKNGSVLWVHARGRCHRDEAGDPTRFLGVVFDITERKRLEQELADRESRYHALFTSIDQGYCVCEMLWDESGRPADYRFIEMNPMFEDATGLKHDVALGRTARDVVPGLEDYWVERYANIVRTGEPTRFESHSPAMGRWFDVYAMPFGENRFALLFSDITERKEAEGEREVLLQRIQAERQRLHQVFSQAPVAVAVLHGREMVFELANPHYHDLVPNRAIVGRPLREVIPELAPSMTGILHEVLDTGEPFVANEIRVPLDRDGDGVTEDAWFNLVYQPLREFDASVSGIVGVAVDVTAQVLARQELERVNQGLEEFAHVASHDLQEPLRMVHSYAQLLIRRLGPEATEEQRQYASVIQSGVNRMEALIRDVLLYSRSVHARDEPRENSTASLDEALARALASVRARIEETEAAISHEPLPTVRGDVTQLAQVFQNLLSNALKYSRHDVPPAVHISAEKHEGQWIISVKDNGIGFEPYQAERIFGLFKRLHREEEYPGTGLGLAICKRIIERYGGKMWAKGEPGAGSTFLFNLPDAVQRD